VARSAGVVAQRQSLGSHSDRVSVSDHFLLLRPIGLARSARTSAPLKDGSQRSQHFIYVASTPPGTGRTVQIAFRASAGS